MTLEGRIAGVFVSECVQAWQFLVPTLQAKDLYMDIRGVTFVDRAGMDFLGNICRTNATKFLTSSPLTRYFAEQATRNGIKARKGSIKRR